MGKFSMAGNERDGEDRREAKRVDLAGARLEVLTFVSPAPETVPGQHAISNCMLDCNKIKQKGLGQKYGKVK